MHRAEILNDSTFTAGRYGGSLCSQQSVNTADSPKAAFVRVLLDPRVIERALSARGTCTISRQVDCIKNHEESRGKSYPLSQERGTPRLVGKKREFSIIGARLIETAPASFLPREQTVFRQTAERGNRNDIRAEYRKLDGIGETRE